MSLKNVTHGVKKAFRITGSMMLLLMLAPVLHHLTTIFPLLPTISKGVIFLSIFFGSRAYIERKLSRELTKIEVASFNRKRLLFCICALVLFSVPLIEGI